MDHIVRIPQRRRASATRPYDGSVDAGSGDRRSLATLVVLAVLASLALLFSNLERT